MELAQKAALAQAGLPVDGPTGEGNAAFQRELLARRALLGSGPMGVRPSVPVDLAAKLAAQGIQAPAGFGSVAAEQDDQEAPAQGGQNRNTDSQESPDVLRAREALKRTRLWSDDELDSMDESELLRRAGIVRRDRANRTSLYQEVQRLRGPKTSRAENRSGRPDAAPSQGSDSESEAGGPDAPFDVDKLDIDDEVKQVLKSQQAELSRLRTLVDQPGDQAGDEPDDLILDDLRAEYADRYRELDEDDAWGAIRSTVLQLRGLRQFSQIGRSKRENMAALMEHAVKAAGFEDVGGRADPQRRMRRNGRLTTGKSNVRTGPIADPMERARAKFDYLRSHPGDALGAARLVGEA